MGMAAATAPLLVVLALLLLGTAAVRASHVVYPELQSLEAENVDETSRTGYHFQPPKHWINGNYALNCCIDTIPWI
jgi:beta-fructofuranosidase